MANIFAQSLANVGHTFGLPNFGISDWLNGGATQVTPNNAQIVPGAIQGAPLSNGVLSPGNPSAGRHPGGAGGSGGVLGAMTGPDATVATQGNASGGRSGGSTYDPNTDPNLVAQARNYISGDQSTLNNLYNAINGALGGYATDARGAADKSYATAQQANDQSYRTNMANTDNAFAGRGAFNSGFRYDADQGLTNAYNQSNQSLLDQRNNAYAQIGQTLQQVQDQLANRPNYDLNNYNDVNSLTTLHNQLGDLIGKLQGTQEQLTPQGALVQKLNSIAPVTTNLDSTLKSQLDSIVKAGTPIEAQQPMAVAYLTRAGITDPKQQQSYLDYLKSLTGGAQTTTPNQTNAQLAGA